MIFLRNLFLSGIAVALLAACDTMGANNSLSFLEVGDATQNLALTRADLAGGAVTLLGPEGYCVDASSLRRTPSGGFAAIASCRILSGGQAGPIVEPGLVTVTVSNASVGVATPAALANVLETELLTTRELSALTVGQMATGGDGAFDGSDPRHWRGTFTLGGHVVGLALYAPKGSPLVGAQGAAVLNTVSSRIRANSKASNGSAEQSQISEDPIAKRLSRLFDGRDLQ